MIKSEKNLKKVKSNSKTKVPILYLSRKLINKRYNYSTILSDYLVDIIEKRKKNYPILVDKCNLVAAPLRASCKILDIIYLSNISSFPEDKQLFEVQFIHINLLKGLTECTSENLKTVLHESDIYFLYHDHFNLCFQFLHASSIFSKTKQIPEEVYEALRMENEDLNSEEVQCYMEYISDVTQQCLKDLVADALDYLSIWCPSLFTLREQNVNKHNNQRSTAALLTKQEKNKPSFKKVRFQFN